MNSLQLTKFYNVEIIWMGYALFLLWCVKFLLYLFYVRSSNFICTFICFLSDLYISIMFILCNFIYLCFYIGTKTRIVFFLFYYKMILKKKYFRKIITLDNLTYYENIFVCNSWWQIFLKIIYIILYIV